MVSVFNLNSKQSGAIKKALIGLVVLLVVSILSFGVGYLKARSSCNKIAADKLEKNLAISQSAARNATAFKLETLNKISEQIRHRAEVTDGCIEQTMPGDLIDILNR